MKTFRFTAQAFFAVVFIVILYTSCEKKEDDLLMEDSHFKGAWGDSLMPGDSSFYGDSVFYGDTVYYGDSVYWGDTTNWNNPGPSYDSTIGMDTVSWENPPDSPYDSGSWVVPGRWGDSLVSR